MTFIRKAISWALGHVRLLIEYALLAAVVMLAGTVLYNRTRIAQAETRIVSLSGDLQDAASTIRAQVAANKQQDEAIAELNRLRELDSRAITGLNSDLAKVGSTGKAIRNKIAELEVRNAQAKALLDTAVPADVGCVLDRTPCPAAGNHPNGSADRHSQ